MWEGCLCPVVRLSALGPLADRWMGPDPITTSRGEYILFCRCHPLTIASFTLLTDAHHGWWNAKSLTSGQEADPSLLVLITRFLRNGGWWGCGDVGVDNLWCPWVWCSAEPIYRLWWYFWSTGVTEVNNVRGNRMELKQGWESENAQSLSKTVQIFPLHLGCRHKAESTQPLLRYEHINQLLEWTYH